MKNGQGIKKAQRLKRHHRIRAKVKGITKHPRLSVFRSAQHIYVQIINDELGKTLVNADDKEVSSKGVNNKTDIENNQEKKLDHKEQIAYQVGQLLAKKAKDKKITNVIFDRGGYKYHGRIKALADGARAGGLRF